MKMVKALPAQKKLPINSVNILQTSVHTSLADKIAPASKSFQDFINSVPPDSLSSFNHVTAEELKLIAKGFKNGKAPGADNIPISIIKKTLDLISDLLLSIINLSVNFIAAKISKSVGLLYKAKYYLPSTSLLTLYYALIYPYLTYCN